MASPGRTGGRRARDVRTGSKVERQEPPAFRRLASVEALGAIVVALAALLSDLKPLSLAFPSADLDGSWMVVLGQAATIPARWGVDLAFTYGPASALVTRYFTDGYLLAAVPMALALAAVFGLSVVRVAVLAAASRPRAGVTILLAVIVEVAGLLAAGLQVPDAFFFAFPLQIFLLDLMRPSRDRVSWSVVLAGAALIGAAAMSKTSYGALALMLFVLADLRSALLVRRPPVLVPAFVAAFLAGYVAFGQHLSDLAVYFARQSEVAAGYGAAMYLQGDRLELFGFVASAAALLAAAIAAAWPRGDRLRGGIAVVGLAIVLLLAFKAGFVRQDTHTQIGWATLGLAGLAVATARLLPRAPVSAAALAGAALGVLWFVAPAILAWAPDDAGRRPGLVSTYRDIGDGIATEAGAWGRFLRDPAGFEAAARVAKADAFATIREQHPLPPLTGTVDILPSEQSSVLASGLDYHPRPSFQDYSTYTAGLIEANRDFYAGASAPEWVLFGIGGLDDRYPTQTEGALWPLLLGRYEPVSRVGALVALHRRQTRLRDVLGPSQRQSARLGHAFAVPAGPVFAHVVVHETLLGRIAGAVFRPPALALDVKLADGETQHSRFVPALGAGGFLLSPMLDSADGFARLAFGGPDDGAAPAVKEAVIASSRLAEWFYDPEITVTFEPVVLTGVAPSAEARPFYEELDGRRPWRLMAHRIAPDRALTEDRLAAPAPTAFAVPTGEARHMKLGFGIEDGAWSTGKVAGVCFSIAATSRNGEAGAGPPLWRRCLDPLRVAADRGPQSAEVDLPPDLGDVTAATACQGSCDWGWSYWNDIEPAS